jgi:hypothetical protein
MAETSDINPPGTSPGTYPILRVVMPRGTNVTWFLDDWDLECDHGLSDAQKCTRLPNYCTPVIKDLIKLSPCISRFRLDCWNIPSTRQVTEGVMSRNES